MIPAWAAALLITVGLGAQDSPVPGEPASPREAVRSVLKDQDYPWYDADRDAVRPVMPDPGSWSRRLGKRIQDLIDWLVERLKRSRADSSGAGGPSAGSVVSTLLMLAAGALFLVVLWQLWRLYDPGHASGGGEARLGDAARIAGLRPGMSLEGVDPWAEALRRRASDPSGAVVWLFLHQLLALQQAGLIRFTPGRTARQYAGVLEDPVLAGSLRTTLGAFEDVYYGHRLPSPARLAAVWARAEEFRSRLAAIREAPGT